VLGRQEKRNSQRLRGRDKRAMLETPMTSEQGKNEGDPFRGGEEVIVCFSLLKPNMRNFFNTKGEKRRAGYQPTNNDRKKRKDWSFISRGSNESGSLVSPPSKKKGKSGRIMREKKRGKGRKKKR